MLEREDELDKIRRVLHGDHVSNIESTTVPHVCLLNGIAGVGKTSLAIHDVYNLDSDGEFSGGVLWLACSNAQKKKAMLHEFARQNGVNLNEIPEDRHGFVLRQLLDQKQPLVVLDDVYEVESILDVLPESSSRYKTLVTTSNRSLPLVDQNVSASIPIEPLNVESGSRLLKKLAKREFSPKDASVINEIIKLVGGLPLAIEIIARQLDQNRNLTLNDSYKLLSDEQNRLQQLFIPGSTKEVRSAFEISYSQIAKDQRTQHLLDVFTALAFSTALIFQLALLLTSPKKESGNQAGFGQTLQLVVS